MKISKRKKLDNAGFKVGAVQEFLHLSDAEMAMIERRIQRLRTMRKRRQKNS
jgi:hypothetical protein